MRSLRGHCEVIARSLRGHCEVIARSLWQLMTLWRSGRGAVRCVANRQTVFCKKLRDSRRCCSYGSFQTIVSTVLVSMRI